MRSFYISNVCSVICSGRVTQSQRRLQTTVGEQRTTARRSKLAYSHPLAPKDPATRNIVVPDTVHAKSGSKDTLPAEILQKRAQRALLRQLQQNLVWEGTVISDERHELIQHFIKLRQNPKYRSSREMMIVGGRDLLQELFKQGYTPKHLLVREGKEDPEWVKKGGVKTEVVRVDRQVAEMCSPGNDGFIGDFDIPKPPPKENLIANKQRFDRVFVLDNVDDPGLLGTMLRTAAAFHYDAVIATNHCADLYDHRVVRAARGVHFQKAVPIYTLREEDGDNVYGMLNHIVRRNSLAPVCYAAKDDDIDGVSEVSDLVMRLRCGGHQRGSQGPPRDVLRVKRETLSNYCQSNFSIPVARGQLLVIGPNHKRNSVRRWSRQLTEPITQLLLDEVPQTDALIAFSVVLHAMRPHGNWDYLSLDSSKQHPAPSLELQGQRASVDIGPNRFDLSEWDLNLDEDEQVEKARRDNEFMRWRRLQRKKYSDYDHWMEAEMQRIREMASNERRQQMYPGSPLKKRWQKGAAGMPEWVPNIIDEYRLPLDRDALKAEREVSEAHVRPENYDR